ncbi:MAG TPA: YihY/virulence factor BrkB family protein, partial [Chloroflexota bacterium]|nr:YihY/virulence factor BrkB family protein [Chloroflexota bacterium]
MESLKAKLEAFQRSRAGLFVKKVLDDQAPNLGALLAWGTLSTLLPLLLGILSVAGLILRDPQRLDQIYNTILVLLPSDAAGPVGSALDGVRQASAAPAGIVAILLLLFNGSSFFANMASVFDQAYHVESRNFIMQRLVAVLMLAITTALVIISTLAAGIGSIVGNIPIGLPVGPLLARVVGWSVSIISVFLLFLLIYKVLPNARQTWRDVLPGTLLASVLLLVISQLFPLYVALFPPNHAYALFGVFLLFTFYLYLLGLVFVLGAELNAFLQEPARSVALAEATTAAQRGRAEYDQQTGKVRAEASGSAPAMQGGGALGSPVRSTHAQVGDVQGGGEPQKPEPAQKPSLAGRIL